MEHEPAGVLAQTIRSLMDEQGVTLRQMSLDTGIPATTLHRTIHGHRPIPVNELAKVAGRLGTSASALIAAAEGAAA